MTIPENLVNVYAFGTSNVDSMKGLDEVRNILGKWYGEAVSDSG